MTPRQSESHQRAFTSPSLQLHLSFLFFHQEYQNQLRIYIYIYIYIYLYLFIYLFIMTTEYRIESDTFGDLKVPANVYWGAQTQR
jgi:hypothetical protein